MKGCFPVLLLLACWVSKADHGDGLSLLICSLHGAAVFGCRSCYTALLFTAFKSV